jgi:hypothetical protein
VVVVADTLREALVAALLLVELATTAVMVAAHPAAMVFPPQHSQRQPSLLLKPKPHPRLTRMDGPQSQFPAKVVAVAVQ